MSALTWDGVTVSVGDKMLLDNVCGQAQPGTVTALMGPSGSGKTTLLSVIAQRTGNFSKFTVTGDVQYNGEKVTSSVLRENSRFVEQEDHLLGCLTVAETIDFSAQMLQTMARSDRRALVEDSIGFFGLANQKNTIVGTALQKGLSGGQKRRLSVACQLVTKPRILFLDEPTSGLDSKASHEVVHTLHELARKENIIVIASIHQPSTLTFNLFDNVIFMTQGRLVYSGPREAIFDYFSAAGSPIPPHYNPAEYILDLINTDFAGDETADNLAAYFATQEPTTAPSIPEKFADPDPVVVAPSAGAKLGALLLRGLTKARRDYLAYYVRLAMYLGLAIMMGTVWLRLQYTQENIQLFTNAIFFSGAFMSFMSVAYIPAYLEDYASYKKERANGLYGPFQFMLANFAIGVPFLFFIATVFSVITYFMCHFRSSATGFFMYLLYLFINLLAAESLTILISTIAPIFVVALALTAFANGLWMAVGGFLVSASVLNVFWYYTFYWIDYQRYAFQGMMFNQFKETVYACGTGCQCMYSSALEDQCMIDGNAVLSALGYGKTNHGLWLGLMVVLIFVLRLATYGVLKMRK